MESSKEVIEIQLEPITQQWVDDFSQATKSDPSYGIALTFATRFRDPEYRWLDRLNIDMKHLLHSEQEYEYHQPLKVGDSPKVQTILAELKERRRGDSLMRLVRLESEVYCQGALTCVCRTTFVVTEPQ